MHRFCLFFHTCCLIFRFSVTDIQVTCKDTCVSQKHERCTFSLHNQLKFQVDSVPHLLLECSGVDANAPNAYLDTFQSMPGSKQGGSPPKADFQMRHIFRSQSLFNGPVASAFNFAADLADILNSTLEPTKSW